MSQYKVYEYIFPDGKIYIGMTKNTIQERRNNGYQHNYRLKTAVKKFGWKSVKTIILADNLSKEDACLTEEDFIARFNSTDADIGFNISKGGVATYKGLSHTDDYKKHMSEINKGKVFSVETLKKMKESHEKERKPVIRKTITGEEAVRFESLSEAALSVNGYKTNISRSCTSGKQYKNYYWSFERR